MTRKPRDLSASVQARLRNVAKERGEDAQLVLTQFAIERLLYRIHASPHRDQFVLKGAVLFFAWTGVRHRATRDLDLLGRGAAEPERLVTVFREFCRVEVAPDGITFDPDSIVIDRIREDQSYEGWRLTLRAELGTARIGVQVDIGFGDAVHPPAELTELPTLLAMPAPTIRTYPRESVVAEKLEAMVSLGLLNSRMKDFFDLHFLATRFAFDGEQLARAVHGTFARRRTVLPAALPVALRDEFSDDATKLVQWRAFLRRTGLDDGLELREVVRVLREFLSPVVLAGQDRSPAATWPAGGPWQDA